MTDFRALCARMADELENLHQLIELELGFGKEPSVNLLAAEARAAAKRDFS